MSALLDLAARCEAATGPDRVLDGMIHCAANGYDFIRFSHNAVQFEVAGKRVCEPCWSYTASLDDAMTLVPEGCVPGEMEGCRLEGPLVGSGLWLAEVDGTECRGATPALALCAAALRAREQA